jgi:hypothetical protein
LIRGRNGEISAPDTDGGHRRVQTELVSGRLRPTAGDRTHDTGFQYQANARCGGIARVEAVDFYTGAAFGPQCQQPAIDGFDVQMPARACEQLVSFVDGIAGL